MGRTKGTKNRPKDKANTLNISEVKISPYIPYGKQMKVFRKMKGVTLTEMAKMLNSHPGNVCHYEKGDVVTGNSMAFACKYAKALGIKQIKLIL